MTADASSVETQQSSASPPEASTPSRKNFTAADDIVLLRSVNLVKPWEAAMGTTNGIMKAFEVVAAKCRAVDGFPKKDGPALRTRFDRLVRTFREAQRASLRSSGSTEEYKERDELLQDIVCRIDNWKELTEDEKLRKRAKTEGIESSGELMRRLAMDELEDEAVSETEEGGDADASASSEASEGNKPSSRQYSPQTPGEREARRDAAEQQRDRSNQEFMLKLLQIAMGKRE
eukprot:jgi/Phyca11/104165/e_gw1.9.548.1